MRGILCVLFAIGPIAVATSVAAPQTWSNNENPSLFGAAEPEITFIESAREAAVVRDIDKQSRAVTLLYPDGSSKTITVGNDVRNFDQIRVGDSVLTEHHQVTKIFERAPQSRTTASEQSSITRSAPGEKPGGTVVVTTEEVATVEGIDVATRALVLREPKGRKRIIKLPTNVPGLERVKIGDDVVIQQTDAVMISVTE